MLSNNYQNILIKFGLWLGIGFAIAIVGISNVFADTYYTSYADTQKYWDNNGSSVTAVTSTWNESLQAYVSGSIQTNANSYGAGVSFNSPIPIVANHTYTLSVIFEQLSYDLATSSKNYVSLGGSLNGSANNYASGSYNCTTQYAGVNNGKTLQFVFKPTSNQLYIFVPWTTNQTHSQAYFFNSLIISDLGESGVTQQDITNSLNSQTNIINSSISSATQQQIDSQKVCNYIDMSSIKTFNSYLFYNGTLQTDNNYGITDYIPLSKTVIEISQAQSGAYPSYCYYDINKTLLQCYANSTLVSGHLLGADITLPSTTPYYVRFSIDTRTNKPSFRACVEGNQALNNSLNDINGSINDLNDSINNDDSSGATSEASDFFEDFTTNTFGLTSIITAPLNLIQSLTSSTCTDLQLPLPYLNNKNITLPCMTPIYQQYFGSFLTIYQTITYGIIAYWVIVRIFNQVKDFKNPEHDEIEVVDL